MVPAHTTATKPYGREFPYGVDVISLRRVHESTGVLWSVTHSGSVPDVTPEHIQARIEDKHAKLAAYRSRCTQVWLIIVADGFAPSGHFHLPAHTAEHTYESDCDRVFYYHAFYNEIAELMTAPV